MVVVVVMILTPIMEQMDLQALVEVVEEVSVVHLDLEETVVLVLLQFVIKLDKLQQKQKQLVVVLVSIIKRRFTPLQVLVILIIPLDHH